MIRRQSLLAVGLGLLSAGGFVAARAGGSPAPPGPTPAAAVVPARGAVPPTPTPVPTADVKVTVLVKGSGGAAAPADEAVAWIPGLYVPRPGPLAPPKPPTMASRAKRFEPRVLAIPAGTTVTFPNYDGIYHNVFSLSEAARFDLGLYRNGASRTMTFDKPGLVRIYCNIHPQMAAYLLVADGSFVARTGKDGVALLSGVPLGRHPLRVWDEKGGDWTGTVDVVGGALNLASVVLDGSAWRAVPHKNKYGKDYPPPDDDENRY